MVTSSVRRVQFDPTKTSLHARNIALIITPPYVLHDEGRGMDILFMYIRISLDYIRTPHLPPHHTATHPWKSAHRNSLPESEVREEDVLLQHITNSTSHLLAKTLIVHGHMTRGDGGVARQGVQ